MICVFKCFSFLGSCIPGWKQSNSSCSWHSSAQL